MKTYNTQFLTILAALMAAGITAQAQYTYTTLDDPGTNANGPDTLLDNFLGTNITGGYGSWFGGGVLYGLVLSGTNWISLTNPSAGSGANQGTYATGMSGTNIVGWFIDDANVTHGYLLAVTNSITLDGRWVTLNAHGASLSPSGGTYAQGIDGTNISGYCTDTSGISHGFLYDLVANTWTPLNAPLAGSSSGQGTFAERISGTNIVGDYVDSSGNQHGFLYDMVANQWTTLNAPGADGGGTIAFDISGNNIVGIYADNSSGSFHGFLYNRGTWSTLDDPLAAFGSGLGTYALGIEGATIVGFYYDSNGDYHGYLATPIPQLETTLSGAALTVSWPYWNNPSTGWILQQNADVTTTNWMPTPTSGISYDGTNNFMSITPSAGNLFFRLSQQ
jgi:hypothetical protein